MKKIQELEKWNDLFKFEMHFEDGTEGFMFKKTQDPMVSLGEIVQFTQNEKGTIKIVKEGSEKYVNQENKSFQKDDDVIMMQCMFKASATFYNGQNVKPEKVSETAILWFESAKNKLNNKNNDFSTGSEAPF